MLRLIFLIIIFRIPSFRDSISSSPNPDHRQDYRTTRPEALPPISFSTSARLLKLKSPSME